MAWKVTVLFFAALLAVGAIAQIWQWYGFVNAGPRFTALDGARLCERIATLERRDGIPAGPCPKATAP